MADDQNPRQDDIEARERAFDELADRLATHRAPGMELVVELSPEMAAVMDTWIELQPDPKPTRSQAVLHFSALGIDDDESEPDLS